MRKIISIFSIVCFLPFISSGQAPVQVSIADGAVNTCNGILFDTGGQGATGYSDNENFTLTICPDVPGDVITLVFNNFNLDLTNTATPPANNADNLSIYDGNSVGAPTLGTYTGSQLQGIIVVTTSANTSGCLTLVFNSNSAGTGVFSATITCTTPCQPPTALFTSPTVPQNPQKICAGDAISFDASASTAQSTFVIVDYIFDYGDGNIDTLQTPFSTHNYNNGPGEYLTTLYVIDDNGCINMNSEIIKVWVSTIPLFNTIISDSVICLGESSCLDGGTNFSPVMYTPSPTSSLTGAAYLDDIVGNCFPSTLNYGFFTPGQTLTNINDLMGICVNMEHTFMGDMVISIICPNGTSVVLHQQGGGGTDLGDPAPGVGPTSGSGWDYCWSPTATNGTWVDNSTAGATPNTVTNVNGDQSLAPGTYESVDPLNALIGCPLNGTWTLEICDLWGGDDGFVFDFWLDLDTSLYPSLTTFTPGFGAQGDSTYWTSTGVASTFITSITNDSNIICITPTDTGTFNYTFNAIDNFGCAYDTTVSVTVVPGPTVDAGNDTSLCVGGIMQLNAQVINPVHVPCDYTIDMYDTFGDGWNGFEIEVIINGVSIGNYTFLNGSTFSDVFSVTDGDIVVFNTISGFYDSEVSYQILDCAGNVVFSDGVNYTGNNPLIGNGISTLVGVSPLLVYNYSWTPTGGLSNPNIANPTFTVSADTTYVVELWEAGHQLCSSFDTINITAVPMGFFAGNDGDTTLCRTYGSFDMFNLLGGIPDAGGTWTDALGNVISNIFDPNIDTSGVYSYAVGAGSCGDTATVTILNPDSVLISGTTTDTVICVNGTANLWVTGTGGTGGLSFIWDNALVGNGPHNVTPSDSTVYTVFAQDTLGCISVSETITVTLFDSIVIELIPSDTICSVAPGNTTTLTANANGGHGNGFNYQWYDGSNNLIGNSQTVNITPTTSPETFTVYVGDDCSTPPDTMTVDIYFFTPIVPIFSSNTLGDCYPVNVNFTNNTVSTNIASVLWTFGDGNLDPTILTTSNNYGSPGCYTVGLEITSDEGCVSLLDSVDMICAYDYPLASFNISPQPTFVPFTEIEFSNTSLYATSYLWTVSGTDTFNSTDLMYEFAQNAGEYEVCLIASNITNCTNEMCQTVIIKEELNVFIPNTFSPNQDNMNEIFKPVFKEEMVLTYNFMIFDRWGSLIFSTSSTDRGWDGTYKGGGKNLVETGTYVYKIEILDINHKHHDYLGSVNIIK